MKKSGLIILAFSSILSASLVDDAMQARIKTYTNGER